MQSFKEFQTELNEKSKTDVEKKDDNAKAIDSKEGEAKVKKVDTKD